MTVAVFPAMGTMVSLTAGRHEAEARRIVERVFAEADATFSLYRDDSELSRLNAGGGLMLDAGPALAEAYRLAVSWRRRTEGAFSPTRPDGLLDLNGVAKAVAMRDAGDLLDAAGCGEWTLVVGGDVLLSAGRADPHIVGVADPFVAGRLLCSVALVPPRTAVATSGSAERGDHIWKAGSGSEYRQVTVMADGIVTADARATAIVALGPRTLDLVTGAHAVDVLVVDESGAMLATPGFRSALAWTGTNDSSVTT